MKRILITCARSLVALDLARKFHGVGCEIFLCDYRSLAISRFSNTCSRFFKVPSPRYRYDEFVEYIQNNIEKYNIDLIIPTCEDILYYAKAKKDLSTTVFCDSLDRLVSLHNKYSFVKLCEQFGLAVPKTSTWNKKNKKAGFVYKNRYSRFSSSDKEVDKKIDENQLWIEQEFIDGEEFHTCSIAKEGKILSHVSYKSNYRYKNGPSTHFSQVHNSLVTTWVKNFVKKSSFTGFISFDLILSKNIVYGIECNPRVTSGIHLCADDITKSIVDDKTTKNSFYKNSGIWILQLLHRPFDLWRKSYQDAIYDSKDLLPFILQGPIYLYYILSSLFKKGNVSRQLTADFEWGEYESKHI